MYDRKHVEGEQKSELLLYALSTCGWCRRTKRLLDELGVAYDYIDVDLEDEFNQNELVEEIGKHNPDVSFPTLIVNQERCIVGYNPDEIRELLK